MSCGSRRWLAGLLSLWLAVQPSSLATTYVALEPYEVLAAADAVVTGSVSDVRAEVRGDEVWTVVAVEVDQWLTEDPALAGDDEDPDEGAEPRETVVFAFLGGEAEGRRLLVAGSPAWQSGAEVLVAFHEQEGLASPVVGFRQGLWRLQDDTVVDLDGRYLALDASGRLVRSDRPAARASVLDAVAQALDGEAPEPAEADGEEVPGPPGNGSPAASGEEGPEDSAGEPETPETPADRDGSPPAVSTPEAPAVPEEAITRTYAVDDFGGPLLLSDRLEEAAADWESVVEGAVEIDVAGDAGYRFAYGDESLFGPHLLTLSLAEGDEVEVLVRPEDHPALAAGLRHELGVLLGLGPADAGVMAMAVADPGALPGPEELAELAALAAFAPQDLDRDGVVGFGDLLELAAAYGRSGLNLPADLDGDGDVDDDDVAVLKEAYTFAPPLGADRPEAPDAGEGVDAEGADEQAGDSPEEPDGDEPETGTPGEPAGPSEPGDPADPALPDEPSEPADPSEPAEPAEPADPDGSSY